MASTFSAAISAAALSAATVSANALCAAVAFSAATRSVAASSWATANLFCTILCASSASSASVPIAVASPSAAFILFCTILAFSLKVNGFFGRFFLVALIRHNFLKGRTLTPTVDLRCLTWAHSEACLCYLKEARGGRDFYSTLFFCSPACRCLLLLRLRFSRIEHLFQGVLRHSLFCSSFLRLVCLSCGLLARFGSFLPGDCGFFNFLDGRLVCLCLFCQGFLNRTVFFCGVLFSSGGFLSRYLYCFFCFCHQVFCRFLLRGSSVCYIFLIVQDLLSCQGLPHCLHLFHCLFGSRPFCSHGVSKSLLCCHGFVRSNVV
mmetsp:Transcript_99398/g.176278  ORF Transcript_99398/g.176278 Transcript_99398/m.176278 type:complete len:319 (-) Transcript_99398:395-1351(-)